MFIRVRTMAIAAAALTLVAGSTASAQIAPAGSLWNLVSTHPTQLST